MPCPSRPAKHNPRGPFAASLPDEAVDPHERLAALLSSLANPVRLRLVQRLQRPAFIPDLAREFSLTRQALKKHLDALVDAGIVSASARRRGVLPASLYVADPTGFFALREMVADLGLSPTSAWEPRPTMLVGQAGHGMAGRGTGLLMVHGDRPGRWFPLAGGTLWTLGREAKAEVALPYDGYASQRHAALRRTQDAWEVTDLHSTNGTAVNFVPLRRGASLPVGHGDVLTVGRTHLALRVSP